MTPFITLTGIAASLPVDDVDTDQIVQGRYLKTVSKAGLGGVLFAPLRFDADARPRAGFVLNRPPWTSAEILIAGRNFGCGSSREHAPWALLDFGIRCIVASSFADIFHANCLKNGILPITLPEAEVGALHRAAADPATARLIVSLPERTIAAGDTIHRFAIDADHAAGLLSGRDEIDEGLWRLPRITAFEAAITYPTASLDGWYGASRR